MSQKISIIVPVYNESRSLPELTDRINKSISLDQYDFEAILVNDGSKDNTGEVLDNLASANPRIKILHLKKNYGQTAAIAAGLDAATGELIVLLDSDLENQPEDIPRLLQKLTEGYDVVSGWRKDRWKGQTLSRKIPSIAANWLISKIARLKLNDYGCTLKAYRVEFLKDIRLYGDMHRFIPAYLSWQGARVAEIPVAYTPRKYGRSNYGISRTFKVILDLVVLKFLTKYLSKPMHFFGAAGLTSMFLGLGSGVLAVYFKLSQAHHKDFISTPLPVLTALFVIVGVLLILQGLLAEILIRVYFESQKKANYTVRKRVNFTQ